MEERRANAKARAKARAKAKAKAKEMGKEDSQKVKESLFHRRSAGASYVENRIGHEVAHKTT